MGHQCFLVSWGDLLMPVPPAVCSVCAVFWVLHLQRSLSAPSGWYLHPQLQACSAELREPAHPQTPRPCRGSQGWKRGEFVINLDFLHRNTSRGTRGELVNPSVRSRGNLCLLLCLDPAPLPAKTTEKHQNNHPQRSCGISPEPLAWEVTQK